MKIKLKKYVFSAEVDGRCLLMFEGITDFIMKDDKRGTDIEAALKRDKDGKKKGGKKDGKKIK